MIIGVGDGLGRVVLSQLHTIFLSVSVVLGPTVNSEVGRLVDKRPGLGIGTGERGLPEGTTEVNRSEIFGI